MRVTVTMPTALFAATPKPGDRLPLTIGDITVTGEVQRVRRRLWRRHLTLTLDLPLAPAWSRIRSTGPMPTPGRTGLAYRVVRPSEPAG